MYRRANVTGVNPLVHYLEGERGTLGGVRVCRRVVRTCAHVHGVGGSVYLVLLSFLMGIYDLVISSYFDSRRLSFFTVGLLDRAPPRISVRVSVDRTCSPGNHS